MGFHHGLLTVLLDRPEISKGILQMIMVHLFMTEQVH